MITISFLVALAVAGCDRFPDLGIQVTDNLVPTAPPNCVVSDDQDQVRTQGVYDLALNPPTSYIISPRIVSYIYDNSTEIQAPAGNMQIQGFEITIKLPDGTVPDFGESLPNPYFVTSSAFLPASETIGGFTQAATSAVGIPSVYRDATAAAAIGSGFDSIVLGIRAEGTTAGGFTQRSPTFDYPILFCDGCLAIDVCESADEEGCYPGQDSWQWCETIQPPAETAL